MKNNELSAKEKLDVAIQSHRFYNQQCVDLEKKINIKIDSIFQTEESGKNIKKKDIKQTVELVNKLLTLSNRYMSEGKNIVNEIGKMGKGQQCDWGHEMENLKTQLMSLNEKQQSIHDRVQEIQSMLIEMHDIDKDTF